jgi:hypothetical protein
MDFYQLPFGAFDVTSLAIFETLSKELLEKVARERKVHKDEDLFQLIYYDPKIIDKIRGSTAMRMCRRMKTDSKNVYLVYPETNIKALGVHLGPESYFFSNVNTKTDIPLHLCTWDNSEIVYKVLYDFTQTQSSVFIDNSLQKKVYTTQSIFFRASFKVLEITDDCVHYFEMRVCYNCFLCHKRIDIQYIPCDLLKKFLKRFVENKM